VRAPPAFAQAVCAAHIKGVVGLTVSNVQSTATGCGSFSSTIRSAAVAAEQPPQQLGEASRARSGDARYLREPIHSTCQGRMQQALCRAARGLAVEAMKMCTGRSVGGRCCHRWGVGGARTRLNETAGPRAATVGYGRRAGCRQAV
jgi:hypothetical protein